MVFFAPYGIMTINMMNPVNERPIYKNNTL